MTNLKKHLQSKRFNYQKALEDYYASAGNKVKIFPKTPSESDIIRLKNEIQNIVDSAKNPADLMDYYQLKAKVLELGLETTGKKKTDFYNAVKKYYHEQGF